MPSSMPLMHTTSTFPAAVLLTLSWLGATMVARAQSESPPPPPLPGYDPSGLIRFANLSEAHQRRETLHRYIWPRGLPSSRPAVSATGEVAELRGVASSLIASVERWEITVAPFNFQSIAFRLCPRAKRARTIRVIVHHGHVPDGPEHYLDAGVRETIEFLLKHGCEVVIMQMPLVGWNQDRTGTLPDGTPFSIEARGTAGHRQLFSQLEPHLKGQTFRLFLEPIVQVANELTSTAQRDDTLLMIGLSGGGWATHMAAAIDTRIDVSIPVAGAMPLYARRHSRGSWGDSEQNHEPLYQEVDRDQDGEAETAAGVASWLEIFALGGIGTEHQPRRQIQVLNLYDSCCFSGEIYRTYDRFLAERVSRIGAGTWEVFVDRSHRGHLISEETLVQVVTPVLDRP